MDATRLAEIEAARQALNNGMQPYDAIVNNVSSGADAQTTLGFIGDVSKRKEENQFAKSVYNGAIVQGGRGIIGTVKMLNELYAEKAMQNGYVKKKEDLMIGWNNILESSPLTRYEVDNTYINNLAEGGGQLLGQVGVGLLTGGTGSMAYMGAQIAGNQYLELKDKGVSTQRAAAASTINAAVQMPLERIGLSKILKSLPAGSPIRKKLMEILESGLTEGLTEFVEEFPEQFTNIWAENPNLDAQGIAKEWGKNADQNVKNALISGSIGAILGGGTSGAKIALQQTVGKKIEEHIHKEKLSNTKENIEHIKNTGIKPEYATIVIDNAMRGSDNVSLDGEALYQYMQQAGAEKVAETLGVSTEEVQKAAEEGLDVEVSYGSFVGTAIAQGDNFYTQMEPHISFEDANGFSTNVNALTKALRKAQEISDTAQADLETEVTKILDSATEAGVADVQTSGLRELLISRAMIANPENPAQYFKDHPLEFQNVGKVDGKNGIYEQSKGHIHKSTAKTVPDFLQEIQGMSAGEKNGIGFFAKTTKGTEFIIAGNYEEHIDGEGKKHPLTPAQWSAFLNYADNVVSFKFDDYRGKRNGIPTKVKIKTPLGYAGFIYDMTPSKKKKPLITTVVFNNEAAIDNWLFNGNPSTALNPVPNGPQGFISSQESFIDIIANKLDEVKPEWRKMNDEEVLKSEKEIKDERRLTEKENADYFKALKKGNLELAQKIVNDRADRRGNAIESRDVILYDPKGKTIPLNKRFLQDSDNDTKGAISWDAEGKAIINLFKGADASTVIHETGHYFLENFMRDSMQPNANAQMKKDRAAILKYAGMTEEQWQKADFEGRRKAHEKLAEAFETYIIEGKAPSRELRSVFKRFSDWLRAVYSSVVNGEKQYDASKRNPNAAEINDEVRQVFDRWFACEEQIKAQERIDGYFAKLPSVVTDHLTDRQKESIKNFIAKAHDKAVDLMTKDAMQIFSQERKDEVAKIRAQAKERAERDVKGQQVYKAIDMLHSLVPGWSRANAKTLARKYLSKGGQVYGDYANAKAEVDADISERINPILDIMREGIDSHPRTYWIDKETGMEADVSDLESYGADELKSGFQFQKVTEDTSADWWLKYQSIYGKRKPSKAKMREIAIEAYMGNDPYGIMAQEYTGLSIAEAEEYKREVAERKAEMEELLKQEKALEAQGNQAQLFKKFYMSDEMRVYWDLVAEKAGYDSGNAMAQDIQNNPTYKQAIEQYLDNVVNEFLPDRLKDPKKAEEATREALYNDESGMVIAVEQQIIEDYANGVNAKSRSLETATSLAQAMRQAAENAAKNEIANMRLKDAMKYQMFVKAERRAAAKAAKALKDGDTELAVTYKRQQAFNHAMVRESLKIRQQVQKNLKFLKHQRKLKKETWGYEYHFNQAANLLARMGIGRKDYDASAKNQSLQQYIIEQVESGNNNIDIADWLLDETIDISSPDKLTFEQYQDVVNALRNIRAVALSERKQFAIAKEKNWQELKADIMDALAPLKDAFTPVLGERPKASIVEMFRAGMRSTDNLFELMDNWHYGWFSKHFGEVLKHCADAETTMRMEFEQRATEAYQKWLPTKEAEMAAEEKVYYDELGASADKHTLVQMAANLGNEGNANRLCGTVPVAVGANNTIWIKPSDSITVEEAIEQTKSNLIEFLGKVLTKEDIEYAQSKIDNADRHWEELAAVERRTKGFAPKKVNATPVAFKLADGSTVVMKGGYLPLVRDGQMGSHPANLNSVSDTDPNQGRNIQTLHTNTGSSKARTMASYPVNLTRGAEYRSMMDTIHDICYRETVADFRKILNDEELYGVMKTKLGVANFQQLREMLEKTANPYSGATDMAEQLFGDTASWLRRKTVNAAIMLNIKTSLQNISNINLFGNAVEGFTQKDAWGAVLGKYGFQAASFKQNQIDQFIMEKSPFMRERVLFPDITVKDIVGEGKQSKIEQATTKWGAMMLAYTDNITAKPVWMAAYEKKINAGTSEQEAIDFADTIIRRTLGSSRTQDVSSLMRGGQVYKMFTTFQGFWNTQYNQWEREAGIFRRDWSEGKRKEAAQRAAAFACAKWISTCIMSLVLGLENPFEDEDDKEWYQKKLVTELRRYPLSMAGPYGQAANYLANTLAGTSSYNFRLAAIESTIDKAIKLGRTYRRWRDDKASGQEIAEGLFSVAFPIVGLPDQANKIFWNSYDYIFNDMDIRVHDLVQRRPKSERK